MLGWGFQKTGLTAINSISFCPRAQLQWWTDSQVWEVSIKHQEHLEWVSVLTGIKLRNDYFLLRLNLSSYIKKVKSLYKDDCLQKYQDVLMAAGNWNRYDRGHIDWEYTIPIMSNIFDTHFITVKGVLSKQQKSSQRTTYADDHVSVVSAGLFMRCRRV